MIALVQMPAKKRSNATTVVPNFASYEECVKAGNAAKGLVRGTKKEVEYVCVEQTQSKLAYHYPK